MVSAPISHFRAQNSLAFQFSNCGVDPMIVDDSNKALTLSAFRVTQKLKDRIIRSISVRPNRIPKIRGTCVFSLHCECYFCTDSRETVRKGQPIAQNPGMKSLYLCIVLSALCVCACLYILVCDSCKSCLSLSA